MKGFRVYRDPESPGYTSGIDLIPDYQKRAAAEGGWEGPWELTTWGSLIIEVVRDPEIPMITLPPVPKETGYSTNSLMYVATALDAWGNRAAQPQAKTKKFIVTYEDWRRKRIFAKREHNSPQGSHGHRWERTYRGGAHCPYGGGTPDRNLLNRSLSGGRRKIACDRETVHQTPKNEAPPKEIVMEDLVAANEDPQEGSSVTTAQRKRRRRRRPRPRQEAPG